jgi:hypothetical protein
MHRPAAPEIGQRRQGAIAPHHKMLFRPNDQAINGPTGRLSARRQQVHTACSASIILHP